MKIGDSFGQYRILESLGKGGMGEVYAAEDTRLHRRVALKVLSPALARDPERLERFEREAQAIAAINHPNIITLHSVEVSGETRFLTMELIEGNTLDQLIPAGGLTLERFFRFSIPLAQAVAAAHRRGITHRDLKPTNIMVDDDEQLKVMDFGLAKLQHPEPAKSDPDDRQTELVTGAGRVLGTVSYMSPEQAEGKTVDSRSDIFSIGVILYEMIAGQRPFTGESPLAILTAIMRDRPEPITRLRNDLPRQLERILASCLAKEPSRRFQTAIDLRNALEALRYELLATPPQSDVPTQEPPPGLARLPVATYVAAALLLGIGAGWLLSAGRAQDSDPLRRDRPLWDLVPVVRHGALADTPAFSPDGAWLAYASDTTGNMDLWRVRVGGGEPEQLTTAPEDETHPAWSPDQRSIAFSVANGQGAGLYLLSLSSRIRSLLVSPGSHPKWSPDGQFIAYDWRGGVYVIAAGGTRGNQVLANTTGDPSPAWSADGESLYVWNRVMGDVQLISLDGQQQQSLGLVPVGEEVASLSVSASGNTLVMSRGPFGGVKTLWAVPLDPESGEVVGEPARLTDPFSDHRHATVSVDGSLVAFAARRVERHLWEIPLDPTTGLVTAGGRPLTSRAPLNYYPALSPDGSRLVWTSHQGAQAVLYSRLLNGGGEEKVTGAWGQRLREVGASFGPEGQHVAFASTVGGSYQIWKVPCIACVDTPVTRTAGKIRDVLTAWSPTDSTLVFYSNRSNNWDIWSVDMDGNDEPLRLTSLPGAEMYPVWHPDGRAIAFRSEQGEGSDLWIMDPDGSSLRPWVTSPGEEDWGAWSPVGGRFYFSSDRSGSFEIWLRQRNGTLVQVTHDSSLTRGLPEEGLYTKFAVGANRLILPIETRTGEIYMLERPER